MSIWCESCNCLVSSPCSLHHFNVGNLRRGSKRSRSTKGASKARRDHINSEIRNMRALLPVPQDDQERLSYLHSMAAVCTYIRKSVLLLGLPADQGPDCCLPYEAFLRALHGFILVTATQGRLVYVSENVSEYLGHSMVDVLQGDTFYDMVEWPDIDTVKSHLETDTNSSTERSFVCCMHTSKVFRLQHGSCCSMLVRGSFQPLPQSSSAASPAEERLFVALCTPTVDRLQSVDSALVSQSFASVHRPDMTFTQLSDSVLYHLGYSVEELTGRSWYSLLHPKDLSLSAGCHISLMEADEGDQVEMVLRLQCKDQSWTWVYIQASKDSEGWGVSCTNYIISKTEARFLMQKIHSDAFEPSNQTHSCPSTSLPPAQTQSPNLLPPAQTQSSNLLPPAQTESSNLLPLVQTQSSNLLPPAQTQSSNLLPLVQTQSSNLLPPAQTQSPNLLPPAQTQSPNLLPLVQTESSNLLPPAQTQSSNLLPPAQTQSPNLLPPAQTQSSNLLPPAQTQSPNLIRCFKRRRTSSNQSEESSIKSSRGSEDDMYYMTYASSQDGGSPVTLGDSSSFFTPPYSPASSYAPPQKEDPNSDFLLNDYTDQLWSSPESSPSYFPYPETGPNSLLSPSGPSSHHPSPYPSLQADTDHSSDHRAFSVTRSPDPSSSPSYDFPARTANARLVPDCLSVSDLCESPVDCPLHPEGFSFPAQPQEGSSFLVHHVPHSVSSLHSVLLTPDPSPTTQDSFQYSEREQVEISILARQISSLASSFDMYHTLSPVRLMAQPSACDWPQPSAVTTIPPLKPDALSDGLPLKAEMLLDDGVFDSFLKDLDMIPGKQGGLSCPGAVSHSYQQGVACGQRGPETSSDLSLSTLGEQLSIGQTFTQANINMYPFALRSGSHDHNAELHQLNHYMHSSLQQDGLVEESLY